MESRLYCPVGSASAGHVYCYPEKKLIMSLAAARAMWHHHQQHMSREFASSQVTWRMGSHLPINSFSLQSKFVASHHTFITLFWTEYSKINMKAGWWKPSICSLCCCCCCTNMCGDRTVRIAAATLFLSANGHQKRWYDLCLPSLRGEKYTDQRIKLPSCVSHPDRQSVQGV